MKRPIVYLRSNEQGWRALQQCFLMEKHNHITLPPIIRAGGKKKLTNNKFYSILWVWPPPSNSDHQDYYIFSRGFQPKPSFATGILRGQFLPTQNTWNGPIMRFWTSPKGWNTIGPLTWQRYCKVYVIVGIRCVCVLYYIYTDTIYWYCWWLKSCTSW